MSSANIDLLNPCPKYEATQHKLKRLVQSPNSFFMDVKCPGKAKLTEGCAFRKKSD